MFEKRGRKGGFYVLPEDKKGMQNDGQVKSVFGRRYAGGRQ